MIDDVYWHLFRLLARAQRLREGETRAALQNEALLVVFQYRQSHGGPHTGAILIFADEAWQMERIRQRPKGAKEYNTAVKVFCLKEDGGDLLERAVKHLKSRRESLRMPVKVMAELHAISERRAREILRRAQAVSAATFARTQAVRADPELRRLRDSTDWRLTNNCGQLLVDTCGSELGGACWKMVFPSARADVLRRHSAGEAVGPAVPLLLLFKAGDVVLDVDAAGVGFYRRGRRAP